MKVLLDSNVLVAAFAGRGLCAEVMEVCLNEHELVLGKTILDEVRLALLDKIRLPRAVTVEIISHLRHSSVTVRAESVPSSACRDPSDTVILGTAVAGDVEVIVTGDDDLLVLESFHGIPIVTPRRFWEMLSGKQ